MDVSQIALALGSSLAAGLNLYLTILTLGLLDRFEILNLPRSMEILANPWVLVTAGILFLIEFVADKIPYVDNAWDVLHSFIRVPAGVILAVGAMSDLPPHLIWIAGLVGGFVSLSAHGAKASTRLAVNATPEPFSNWALSITEDVISLGVIWLVSNHPYLAIASVLFFVCLAIFLIVLFYRFFKMIFRRQRPAPAANTS